MKFLVWGLLFSALLSAAETLRVTTIDVEGGKAVLVISPLGESLLIDAGWARSGTREASTDLLVRTIEEAGLKQLDYVLITHYDVDHMGDVPALAARVPIRHLIDHGAPTPGKGVEQRYGAYSKLFESIDHMVAKPGDRLPLKGVDIRVVSSAGKVLAKALPRAGSKTESCAGTTREAEIPGDAEDNNSIGLLLTYGKFRLLDLADLEAYKSFELACPVNLIGAVDVLNLNVHGQFKGMSAVLLDAVRPRVTIVANGARKGADPQSWPMLSKSPELQDIWQSHLAVAGGKENNPAENFIANVDAECSHKPLRLVANRDGSFTISGGTGGFQKTYPPASRPTIR